MLIAYVPTVMQIKQFVDQARTAGFGAVQVTETLLRPWHVSGLSIRPVHRMVAHTGFVIICRRLVTDGSRRRLPADDGRHAPRCRYSIGAREAAAAQRPRRAISARSELTPRARL